MVPEEGLEPSRTCVRQILSLLRLPLRHSGPKGVKAEVYHTPIPDTTAKLPCRKAAGHDGFTGNPGSTVAWGRATVCG